MPGCPRPDKKTEKVVQDLLGSTGRPNVKGTTKKK